MQRRFAANPQFQATLLLLQERIPKATAFYTQAAEVAEVLLASSEPQIPIRVLTNPNTLIPEVQLLSNGRYNVMITNAGGGYSRCKDFAVTRWQEDSTRDHWGTFCYIRDVASGAFWSTAHQPTLTPADHYEAIFSKVVPNSAAVTTISIRTSTSWYRRKTTLNCAACASPTIHHCNVPSKSPVTPK